ncbi:hypothetical protein MP638_001005 [Amoeboaphelidium occidentale]|nr:hypothetical protein MP638_001005 [Amoeboaphelidium occidentale]
MKGFWHLKVIYILFARAALCQRVYDHCLRNGVIALTFDDGPWVWDQRTKNIMDVLDKHGIPATFFVICSNIANETVVDLLKDMVARGHELGLHGFEHKSLKTMSEPEIRHSMRLCDNVLLNSVGFIPKLYRAPYGEWTEEAKFVLSSWGKALIQWSFDSRDWESLDSNQIYRAAESQMLAFKPEEHNWISLFHDLYQETASSLDRIIASALSLGYSFVTISECIRE